MPLILSGNVASATASTTYKVANSCRFNDGDSALMHKTAGSVGNMQSWTVSLWCKRGVLGTKQTLFSAYNSGSHETECHFETDDTLNFRDNESGSWMFQKNTTQKFRDCSSWYHLVFSSVSGTQKIWVNGVEVTAWETNTNGSGTSTWNNDKIHAIGCKSNSTDASSVADFFDGYIAEFVSIDGSTLTPTSFGEFSEDSPTIWIPKDVSGLTFGTNGFYCDFEASDNLGNDANGGTDLTEVNLAAVDQSLDTPTLNFPVMNNLDAYWPTTGSVSVFSEGNLQVVSGTGSNSSTGYSYNNATFALTAGKWYWEVKSTNLGGASFIGIISQSQLYNINLGECAFSTAHAYTVQNSNGNLRKDNSTATYGASFTTNDIVSVALDLDNNKIYWAKNGDWSDGSGSWDSSTFDAAVGAITVVAPASTTGNGHYFPTVGGSDYSASSTWQLNFGSAPYTISSGNADANGYGSMEYAVPSGFLTINSYNLGTTGG